MAEIDPGLAIAVTEERPSADVAVISVAGQIDLYTAPDFKAPTVHAIEDGAKHLVVDLTRTTFMDSTGLGVLVGAMKRLRPLDGSIAIVCPDTGIRSLFEISGLAGMFAIYETRDEIPGAR